MLIITNRQVAGAGAPAEFTRVFAPGKTELSQAEAKVDSKGRWTLKNLVSAADDTAIVTALSKVFSGGKPVLLYLHGNNNTPVSCFERCALLESMYGVATVGFSWASEGSLPDGSDLPGAANTDPGNECELDSVRASNRNSGTIVAMARRYRQAKNNAQDSVDALARCLRLVSIARLQTNLQPYSVAAHSLGAHFLQYTLEIEAAREALGSSGNLALLAACTRASGHTEWVGKLRPRGKVFVTYHQGDSVLFGAFLVDGSQVKLGTEPGNDRAQNGLVRYIDFTNSPVGLGGHGYFVYPRLGKKTRTLFTRMFSSLADIEPGEYPRQVYQAGCDADGVTCYVGVASPTDGG